MRAKKKSGDMEMRDGRLKVLMLPWLAHGHIFPFLELAKKLTEGNFYIYFCSTPVNLDTIKPKISKKYYNSLSVQLVELHLPSLPELPPHYHTTKGLPPNLMPTLKRAFDMGSSNFAKILKCLSPDLLIYDFLQPWAPALAHSLNIPAVEFLSPGASIFAICIHGRKKPGVEFPFPAVYFRDYELSKRTARLESNASGIKHIDRVTECHERSSKIILIKTFREIEGKYVDYLSELVNKRVVPVGHLIHDCVDDEEEKMEITEWLDQKGRSSTVFVSFGTEYFLSKEEMTEIAYGLELSKVNFIWVVRFPMGQKISVEEALPGGFSSRVGDRGMLVEDWAPQTRILRHPSTGGFVSHCGWNSMMESMKFGVPIIAVPIHLDQPVNARLAEEVGVGVEVRRDENGRLRREDVAEVIEEVMMERRRGDGVRKKAKAMSKTMRNKRDEEMDEVVEELVQLCKNPRMPKP